MSDSRQLPDLPLMFIYQLLAVCLPVIEKDEKRINEPFTQTHILLTPPDYFNTVCQALSQDRSLKQFFHRQGLDLHRLVKKEWAKYLREKIAGFFMKAALTYEEIAASGVDNPRFIHEYQTHENHFYYPWACCKIAGIMVQYHTKPKVLVETKTEVPPVPMISSSVSRSGLTTSGRYVPSSRAIVHSSPELYDPNEESISPRSVESLSSSKESSGELSKKSDPGLPPRVPLKVSQKSLLARAATHANNLGDGARRFVVGTSKIFRIF